MGRGPVLKALLTLLPVLALTDLRLDAADLVRIGDATADVRVGALIEWRVEGIPLPLKDDTDLAARVVFSQPGRDHSVTRLAFRYLAHKQSDDGQVEFLAVGQPELHLRHVFRHAGAWRWSLQNADGKQLQEGQLTVAAAARSGGPYRIAGNGLLLAHADGSGFVPVGCNICWGTGPRRLDQMKQYLTRLQRAGGNHFRLWTASWCGQIESDITGLYRHDHAWLLDEILRHAQRLDLRVTLVFDNAHDLVHGKAFPYGADVATRIGTFLRAPLNEAYKKRLAWFMSRYAAFDCILAWELFNELDEALIGQPKPMDMQDEPQVVGAWTKAAAALVKQLDPERLVTVSLASQPWHHIYDDPNIDLAQIHCYLPPLSQVAGADKDAVDLLLRARQSLGRNGFPVRFSETGYQGSNEDNPANLLDPNGVLLRNQAWAGFLLGGYGSSMNWWWDIYIDEHQLWSCYTPMAKALAQLDWADAELRPRPVNLGEAVQLLGWQSPTQALLWPRHPADTWYRLTIEGLDHPEWPDDSGPSLRLAGFAPEQDYHLIGWDMDIGTKRFAMTLTSTRAGSLLVHLPAGNARAVLIIRQLDDAGLDNLD